MNARSEDTHPLPLPFSLGAALGAAVVIWKIAAMVAPGVLMAVRITKALGAMVIQAAGDLALAATAGLLIALSIGAVTKGRP